MTKELRREIYLTQFELGGKFPDKPVETADLSAEIEYSKKLVETVSQVVMEDGSLKAKNALSKINELLASDKIKEIQSLADVDREVNGFVFNKDANTYQCPAGHLSTRKAKSSKRDRGNKNQSIKFYFDVEKCKVCHLREGCYKCEANFKTYSISILSDIHEEQRTFQETNYFKERAKLRYMIEAKNAEMKQDHGLGEADSNGLAAMRLQSYFTAFVVNIKRIVRLLEPEMV